MSVSILEIPTQVVNMRLNRGSILAFRVGGLAANGIYTLQLGGDLAPFFQPIQRTRAFTRPTDNSIWIISWLLGAVAPSIPISPDARHAFSAEWSGEPTDPGLTVTITSDNSQDTQPVPAIPIDDPGA